LIFSGYKFFTSAGAFLYGKEELLKKLRVYDLFGHSVPYGTMDIAKFASIKAVVEYLVWLSHQVNDTYKGSFQQYSGRIRSLKVAMDAVEKYERELSKAMLLGSDETPGLTEMRHVEVYGITDVDRLDQRDPAFAFKVRGMEDIDVAKYLWDKHNVALRFGDLWNRSTRVFGVSSMLRASLTHYNTVEEIYTFLKGLNEIGKKLSY
jgi:selenocysteine lyase/cysteine desulfurase